MQWPERVLSGGIVVVVSMATTLAMAAPPVDEFLRLDTAQQAEMLRQVGYQEGGEIGDLQALLDYVAALDRRYDPLPDIGALSDAERLLLYELALAHNTLMLFITEGKAHLLRGCRLGYELAAHLPPDLGNRAQAACYAKYEGLSPAEVAEVHRLALGGYERIIERAQASDDSEKNFYLFDSGRYRCAVKQDCVPEGVDRMYEAALREYDERGGEDFSLNIVGSIGELRNTVSAQQDLRRIFAMNELTYELNELGRYQVGFFAQGTDGKNTKLTGAEWIERVKNRYRTEAASGNTQAADVVSALDAGQSILDLEVARYRDGERSERRPAAEMTTSVEPTAPVGPSQPQIEAPHRAAEDAAESEPTAAPRNDSRWIAVLTGMAVLLVLAAAWLLRRRTTP
jgi:MYXO-CTERM domain-containing protein